MSPAPPSNVNNTRAEREAEAAVLRAVRTSNLRAADGREKRKERLALRMLIFLS